MSIPTSSTRPQLGTTLLQDGWISTEQLDLALRETKRNGLMLGQTLVSLGFITEKVLAHYLAEGTHTGMVDLSTRFIPPEILDLVPYELAAQFQVLPIGKRRGVLELAMADPLNIVAVDTIESRTGLNVHTQTAPVQEISEAIEGHYAHSESIKNLLEELSEKGFSDLGEDASKEAPLIRLCNQLITAGIQTRVTDIHIEPDEQYLRIRMRIDGILAKELLISKPLQAPITARLKLMANLNLTEKRTPQDGRISFTMGTRRIDLRVSTLPTNHGESLVLRILDKGSLKLEFRALGFTTKDQTRVQALIQRPHGIILVTGPTGSGKTTTLYTALRHVNAKEKSVFTLEDPIEYQMPMIRQTQVNPDIDMTFSAGLRALLRQDPDVILVGEIRDQETADLAMRAALTGHLVFSTLHTNNALGAIPRLIDMGIEPFLIASALTAIIGQRLVRCICPGCKTERTDSEQVLRELNMEWANTAPHQLWTGTGCRACNNTGYKGRAGIYEIIEITDQLHDPIVHGPDIPAMQTIIQKQGWPTMFHDGFHKALNGITTIEEVLRVTGG
ncbi:MAG: GspE/PulE family protein [Nitrospirota bacterium]|nr:GspE/PulE family protein [Nitrospirota bacterium]MDH5587228.1 GspE/PulE family protein [Nitrospirota bacterium]